MASDDNARVSIVGGTVQSNYTHQMTTYGTDQNQLVVSYYVSLYPHKKIYIAKRLCKLNIWNSFDFEIILNGV